MQMINGFSKLSKQQKIDWLVSTYFQGDLSVMPLLKSYWIDDMQLQKLHDEFI